MKAQELANAIAAFLARPYAVRGDDLYDACRDLAILMDNGVMPQGLTSAGAMAFIQTASLITRKACHA